MLVAVDGASDDDRRAALIRSEDEADGIEGPPEGGGVAAVAVRMHERRGRRRRGPGAPAAGHPDAPPRRPAARGWSSRGAPTTPSGGWATTSSCGCPRIGWAAEQVDLEATWLPRLAPHLPVDGPRAGRRRRAGRGLPVPLGGPPLDPGRRRRARHDRRPGGLRPRPRRRRAGAPGACRPAAPRRPGTGPGRCTSTTSATRRAIDRAGHLIDAAAATAVWEEALAAPPHDGPPVWVHGDLEGNCLVRDGRLCGLVDWGSACAGDPAVDVQVVWSPLFTDESRAGLPRRPRRRRRHARPQPGRGDQPGLRRPAVLPAHLSAHRRAVVAQARRPRRGAGVARTRAGGPLSWARPRPARRRSSVRQSRTKRLRSWSTPGHPRWCAARNSTTPAASSTPPASVATISRPVQRCPGTKRTSSGRVDGCHERSR